MVYVGLGSRISSARHCCLYHSMRVCIGGDGEKLCQNFGKVHYDEICFTQNFLKIPMKMNVFYIGVRSFTGMDMVTGMDYQNGHYAVALGTFKCI